MAGPGDQIAASAGGRGHLRASHADREQAVSVLKAAFVQGLLDKDEFDLRIGQVLASRTYTELAALTADIPARLTAAQPLSEPALNSANKKAVKVWGRRDRCVHGHVRRRSGGERRAIHRPGGLPRPRGGHAGGCASGVPCMA